MKRIILAQFIVLFVGTLFAWFNFATELIYIVFRQIANFINTPFPFTIFDIVFDLPILIFLLSLILLLLDRKNFFKIAS